MLNREQEKRFWAKIEKTKSCWIWKAALTNGYGVFGIGGQSIEKAHRIVWILKRGPIPKGMFVCHRCDVRACVKPAHLFLGTVYDNNDDMIAKGRHSPPPNMGGWNRFTLPAQVVKLLGKKPDTEIGRQFGFTKYVIQRHRRRRGIKPFPCPTRFKSGDPHPRWSRRKEV